MLSTPKTPEEIRTHAEKKEYQDFVYYTNQMLNKLSEGIVALSLQHEKMFSKHMSLHKNLEIGFEEHMSDMNQKIGRAFCNIDDFRADLGQIQGEVKEHLNTSNRFFVTKQDLAKMVDYIYHQQKLMDDSFTSLKNFVESKLGLMNGIVEEKISNSKQELLKAMPSIDPIREEFKVRIETFYIDFAGLVKEIALLKEAIKYGDKKFENLYTLIERLKKGIP